MNEQQEKATRNHEAALKEVRKQLVGKPGNRAEAEYGEAYRQMVVAGIAPKIKKKYSAQKKYVSNN